ncbi:MAG: transglutaminase domain-containing protein [Spirochaetales bacterium]|nr:transglutaminase domain-containing protein [Spirochaetales bacterium]
MTKTITVLKTFKTQGRMSDPGPHISMLKDLPDDPQTIRLAVQNCLIHLHWLPAYGIEQTEKHWQEAGLRSMEEKLNRLQELGYETVTKQTAYKNHLTGTCRDYAVFLCSLLRHKAIPARARCGFGCYFESGKFIDHWICEYWDAEQSRWIMMDAQLDTLQMEKLHINFDPASLPEDQFTFGGRAWQLCREQKVDPSLFGIFKWWGIDYAMSNFLLDIGSLNKTPMLPWDCWAGMKAKEVKNLTEEELSYLDKLAVLSLNPDDNYVKIKQLYEQDDCLKVPDDFSKVWNCSDATN